MLTIVFDSEISKQLDVSKEKILGEVVRRSRYVENFHRTTFQNIENDIMKRIEPIPEISTPRIDLHTLDDHLQFHPKNKCQEQFIYAIIRYPTHSKKNVDYCHNCVFVTENPIYFEKYIPGGTKKQCLRNYFPNLILTN